MYRTRKQLFYSTILACIPISIALTTLLYVVYVYMKKDIINSGIFLNLSYTYVIIINLIVVYLAIKHTIVSCNDYNEPEYAETTGKITYISTVGRIIVTDKTGVNHKFILKSYETEDLENLYKIVDNLHYIKVTHTPKLKRVIQYEEVL